jgi:hypothetical protein
MRFAFLVFGLASVYVFTGAAPRPAQASLLDDLTLGRWAIGSAANCAVLRKLYTLKADAGTITWRDGVGNIDVETVVSDYGSSFSTVTLQSIHVAGGGEPKGQTWTYTKLGPDVVRVTPGGKAAFLLVRCG